jgi:signal-transduction protein with cAMP-binding, CBS, and nucleotidyltransferase domain
MTNRKIADIVKDKKFLVLPEHQTVQEACRCMWEWRIGAVLVLDNQQGLAGIFTGRDAVRTLAEGRKAEETTLSQAMTADPVTISPENHAIDALHEMSNHGFRHLPVVASGKICGLVARSDFLGMEVDRLDEEIHLSECLR